MAERSKTNAWRREGGLREKLGKVEQKLSRVEWESQVRVDKAIEAVEERYEERLEEWRRVRVSLKKEHARLGARDRREPLRIQHAVQKALKHSGDTITVQPTVCYVKGKRGIIQDWARNAIVTLVNEGVPMSKTWVVTKVNAVALGVEIVGEWSTRTSRRVVREGSIAAELMIANYVLNCISPW